MIRMLAAATALWLSLIAGVEAQDYPNRLIRMVQGFPPGGNVDIIARILANEFEKSLGQSIVVEAKPGLAGALAAEAVARSEPDGYTLLVLPSAHPAYGALSKNVKYKVVDDFTWISVASFYPFMVVDIFPNIDIPVVYVAWNYPGLSAEDMERRVVLISERAYSTTVNGIERIESLSIPGLGILKVYFTQGTDIGGAIAQINAQNNSILRIAPPGITPPNMIRFNASNVPVVQVTLNSKTIPEQQIFGLNFLRIKLFTIPGVSIPAPYGGKQRQIIVDVDPVKLSAKGLSQMDVVGALQSTNVIVPAGVARIGEREFNVKLNSSPLMVDQFQSLPVGCATASS